MFDPFFPLLLLCGPLGLVMLVVFELRRRDRSLMPNGLSIGLAIPAIGGLSMWLVVAGVERWGEGMDESGFNRLMGLALLAAIACIVGCYCLLALFRARRRSKR